MARRGAEPYWSDHIAAARKRKAQRNTIPVTEEDERRISARRKLEDMRDDKPVEDDYGLGGRHAR